MKKANYNKIPVSEKTENGMSLTSDDRQYLQRMFVIQDEAIYDFINETYDLHAKLICDTVREMINEVKLELNSIKSEIKDIKDDLKCLHSVVEENREDVRKLKKDMVELQFRVKHIEKKLGIC